MSDDPARLSAGGADAPQALRELLASAKTDLPSAGSLSQLAARLPLGPPPIAAPPPGAASGAGVSGVAKLIGGLAVVGAVVGGAIWLTSERTPPGVPVATPPSAPVASPPPAEAPAPAAEPPPVVHAPSAVNPPASPKASGPSEAALLQQAQAALRRDPARSLALTHEHRRRFPKGALAQEREVIAIDALSRLGRSGEAGKRAEEFGKEYPGSAHQKKVETSVEP
jgi:hypothetical protein